MRAVPDRQLVEPGVQNRGKVTRTGDGNRIEAAVNHKRWGKRDAGCELAQPRLQIVIVQASPDLVLRAGDDPKWREVFGVAEITEIAGDGELEGAALIRLRVPLAQPAGAESVARALDLGSLHAPRKLRLELSPILGAQRRGRDQRKPRDVLGVFEEVEHREQAAPGIAAQRQPVETEMEADRL